MKHSPGRTETEAGCSSRWIEGEPRPRNSVRPLPGRVARRARIREARVRYDVARLRAANADSPSPPTLSRVRARGCGSPRGEPLQRHQGQVNTVAVGTLGGEQVIVSGGEEGALCVWERAVPRSQFSLALKFGVWDSVLRPFLLPAADSGSYVSSSASSLAKSRFSDRRSLTRGYVEIVGFSRAWPGSPPP
jgi:hypothetical protein